MLARAEYQRQYRKTERGKSWLKLYRKSKKSKEYTLNWRLNNKDKTIACTRRNQEKSNLRTKLWRINNREKYLICKRLSDLKRMAHGRKTLRTLNSVILNSNMICYLCGKIIFDKYHIDHIVPISKGGTNKKKNLALTHPICNRKKHNKFLWELELE